jgi:putative component of toxin-antitoxin plasmid stabilization module
LPYDLIVLTVAETAVFVRYAAEVWSDAEREAFISWIAANPNAGDVIPGSGGCRKVRWGRQGQGKRGGARVIYFVASGQTIWLLIVCAKAKFDNLPAEFLAELKREVEHE